MEKQKNMKITKKEIAVKLFGKLLKNYLKRVPYAQRYLDLVTQKGGTVIHDHIAFRTFNIPTGEQPGGIQAISHILECLDYMPCGKYDFVSQRLKAVHFEHADEMLPKIFVSQLELKQLPEWAQNLVHDTVCETPYLLSDPSIILLRKLKTDGILPLEASEVLINDLVSYFQRPWDIPYKDDVLKLNDLSQYGAWVLLHGNSVNHFAAFINYQNIDEWPDLEATSLALINAGIPMKKTFEGEKGSKLWQTATLAVKEEVEVKGEDGLDKMMWTYAYYELAQRDIITENGQEKLFSGFLGEQASQLFEMTKTREN